MLMAFFFQNISKKYGAIVVSDARFEPMSFQYLRLLIPIRTYAHESPIFTPTHYAIAPSPKGYNLLVEMILIVI